MCYYLLFQNIGTLVNMVDKFIGPPYDFPSGQAASCAQASGGSWVSRLESSKVSV